MEAPSTKEMGNKGRVYSTNYSKDQKAETKGVKKAKEVIKEEDK